MDLSFFLSPSTWITLITLIFLEIVLGVDNIVFISITSDRLPKDKQHIGRKLGLAGAFLMRCLFLAFASYLAHMKNALFTIQIGSFVHPVSVHDIIMFVGGAYLIYKGIAELVSMLKLTEIKAEHHEAGSRHTIGLGQAIGTIMAMDVVFSIDSVITAVGLADHLIIMILAVMIAIILMMIFIDPIADFINAHAEMKLLALVFITVIGVLLVLEGLTINSGIEVLDMHMEKLMVYFAMIFAVILAFIQIKYKQNLEEWKDSVAEQAKAEAEETAEEPAEETADAE
ncbi:MAG: TerC family protein [Eggerthellaceae bacterium]|nr:TerC family protein [Eggerthellaceae bacterium]